MASGNFVSRHKPPHHLNARRSQGQVMIKDLGIKAEKLPFLFLTLLLACTLLAAGRLFMTHDTHLVRHTFGPMTDTHTTLMHHVQTNLGQDTF